MKDNKDTRNIDSAVKDTLALKPVNRFGAARRWLGIYTADEKEVLDYARRLKQFTMLVVSGDTILTSRPEWMRHEDYTKLRALAQKVERRKNRRK